MGAAVRISTLQQGHIEAVLANETEAEFLGVERGAPLLMLDSVSFDETGRPIEYYHAVHRGDRSRFEVELIRVRDQSKLVPERSSSFTSSPQEVIHDNHDSLEHADRLHGV